MAISWDEEKLRKEKSMENWLLFWEPAQNNIAS
jgi:hypothetical protein